MLLIQVPEFLADYYMVRCELVQPGTTEGWSEEQHRGSIDRSKLL